MTPGTEQRRAQPGWWRSLSWFALWTAVGLLSVIVPMPFGPVLLGAIIVAMATRKQSVWPEILGIGAGLGVFGLLAGVNNLGPPPACSEVDMADVTACYGVPPGPFLVAGTVLVTASLGTYLVLRFRAP